MSNQLYASANPTKKLFIEMLTRDISLEDSVLDLVDNSIDSYIRHTGLYPDISSVDQTNQNHTIDKRANININYSSDYFCIKDDCEGFSLDRAQNDIFNFGKLTTKQYEGGLSVYGIGLKRAVLKMGREIEIISYDGKDYFSVNINVDNWLDNDQQWYFPINIIENIPDGLTKGTKIYVTKLYEDVTARFKDGIFGKSLETYISKTYALFLDGYANIYVNDNEIIPDYVPLGDSSELTPAYKHGEINGVQYDLFCGLANPVNSGGSWQSEKAGWYIACNGRLVVFADKSELTEWGNGLPKFHPQFRGFVGAVFFKSENPENLPWTTTKRGISKESKVYRYTLPDMAKYALPVIQYLRSKYQSTSSEDEEEDIEKTDPIEKDIANNIKQTDLKDLVQRGEREFAVTKKQTPSTIKVQFQYEKKDLEKIRSCLGKKSWSAKDIGYYAMNYLLEQKCGE